MKHILAVTCMFALSFIVMGCGNGSSPDSNKPVPTPDLGEASSDPSLMNDAATADAADSSDPQPSNEKESAGNAANESTPDAVSEQPEQTSKRGSKPVETEVIEDDQDEED